MEQHIFGVTEVNHLVKLLLDSEPMLQNISVRGELSNYKIYPSGHHYFSLKDPEGALRCVMFKSAAMRPVCCLTEWAISSRMMSRIGSV